MSAGSSPRFKGTVRGRLGRLTGAGLALAAVVSLALGVPAGARLDPSDAVVGRAVATQKGTQAAAQWGAAAPVPIDLCAKAGTVTMPDLTNVPIWGFVLKPLVTPCSDASVEAQLPGPALDFMVGDLVTITLHNEVPGQNVSLLFPGQNLFPDTVGVPPGGSKVYSFTASEPGTYLYESGANAPRTVPMGLYGALIVRPMTPNQAYGSAASAYDAEAVLVLSEIDPAFNSNPNSFNLVNFAPKYWLINGKSYPETDPIPTSPLGPRVLLRYLNAGTVHHTMTLLGTHQRVIAKDAYPVGFPYDVVPETIPAGSTLDTIATIPSGAASGTKFWLYNRQLHLDNAGAFPGGMLTFIEVGS